jgi:hypothetical protein
MSEYMGEGRYAASHQNLCQVLVNLYFYYRYSIIGTVSVQVLVHAGLKYESSHHSHTLRYYLGC